MAKWYYSVDGRAEGPADEAVIIENLKAGKLTLVDLVFREGDDRWKAIGEIDAFKNAFASVHLPPNPAPQMNPLEPSSVEPLTVTGEGKYRFQPLPELTWVLLVKINRDGQDQFHQSGPYSLEQIEDKLTSRQCLYSDYVWRPGYRRWARIGNLPEFDRRRKSRDGDRVAEMVPFPDIEIEAPVSENLLGSVLRASPSAPVAVESESPPPETDGQDFAEITATHFDLNQANAALKAFHPGAFAGDQPVVGPPPVEPRGPDSNDLASASTPSVPERPSLGSTDADAVGEEDMRTVVYGGPVRLGGAAEDGKTVIYGAISGQGSQLPPPLDGPPEVPSRPAFDPDATMVQMAPRAPVDHSTADRPIQAGADDLLLEEAPARWYQNRQISRLALGGVAMVAIAVFAILFFKDKDGPSGGGDGEPPSKVADQRMKPKDEISKPSTRPSEGVARHATDPSKGVAPKPSPAPAASPATTAALSTRPSERDPRESGQALNLGFKPLPAGTGRVTSLEVVPVRADGAKIQFAANTDAAVGTTIYLSLWARSGDVLRYPSFYATASVVRTKDPAIFDLTYLKLPPGKYRLEMATGDLRRSRTVFLGTRDADFEASMELHLKQISYQQQREKKALFHSARVMESLAKDLGENYFRMRTDARKWRTFYVSWQKDVVRARKVLVDQVAVEKRNELAYPDEIIALKIAATKLAEQASALNDSILSNTQARDVAGSANFAIIKEFSRLRTLAAEISSRRN